MHFLQKQTAKKRPVIYIYPHSGNGDRRAEDTVEFPAIRENSDFVPRKKEEKTSVELFAALMVTYLKAATLVNGFGAEATQVFRLSAEGERLTRSF